MPGVIYDRFAQVWRSGTAAGVNYPSTEAYKAIPCTIVPLSKTDERIPYALQSTHYLIVPHWVWLRREDEVRTGRRAPDSFGTVDPEVFVVNGRARYTLSVTETSYYCSERL